MQELNNCKSKELALLSEMLGIESKHDIHGCGNPDFLVCDKCKTKNIKAEPIGLTGKFLCNDPCPIPDPITTDLRILAWQVQRKMAEINPFLFQEVLKRTQRNVIKGYSQTFLFWMMFMVSPEDIIKAGIEVYKEHKT